MTVYRIPAPIQNILDELARFEIWQQLLIILAVLFVLNLLLQFIAVLFGGAPKPIAKPLKKDFTNKKPKAAKVKAQLRESGLAVQRTPSAAPASIPLVSDEEVTTTAVLPRVTPVAVVQSTLPAPKLDTLDDVLNELEKLDARIGRDKSGSVVMIFLNGKELPPGILNGMKFFPKLESLHLRRTNVSDLDVPAINAIKQLRFLYATETQLSNDGLTALKKGNGNLKIEA
ncbi:hypothetical protein [Lacunimicrobium album]